MRLLQNFLIFILLTAIGILYKRYEGKYFPDEELDKYNLVRKYLLNESESMTGKEILWIHTKHEINSRDWASFGSRNSRKLNQPYKDLCVESIIRQCGDSFNVCLINDDSIPKLLPEWTIQLNQLPNPIKENVRNLGLCKLLEAYGGLIVPDSSIMLRNIKDLHNEKLDNTDMYVSELVNRNSSSEKSRFFPSRKFMGCKKGSKSMKELIENLEIIISENQNDFVKFDGLIDKHINKLCTEGKCSIVCGKALGVKDKENKVILIEDLLNDSPLNLCMCSLKCIILPDDEILKRHKYNWFARLSHRQVLEGDFEVSKFMVLSLGK